MARYRWERELYVQLRKADGVIFLASTTSVVSHWCFAEVSLARSLGHDIFPLRVDREAWLGLLSDVQWVDLAEGEAAYTRLLAGLRRAGLDPADSFAWDRTSSPYPGLKPFDRQDAAVFFGRDKEILRLEELLNPTLLHSSGRFVAIVGPSGSGKSSLLRAGLLPRLERLPERWVVLPVLLPGRQPVRNLARSIAEAFRDLGTQRQIAELADQLAGGPSALAELARELAEISGASRGVLVVIDQAEELVTRSGAHEQQAFLTLLRGAIHEDSPLWAVATIRAEFLSAAPDRAGLAEAIDDALVVEPLSRARLPEVIERPARRAGVEFAPGLVQRMVEDTTGGDALPLLACTLQELYEQVGYGGLVSLGTYESLDGVVGYLHRQADKITDELRRRGHGSHVLPALLRLAGIGDTGEPTRRRVRRNALSPEESIVIQSFIEARLLTSSGTGEEATVEVAHEALLRQWTPLREEIEASQRGLRMRSEVERLANDWQRGNQDESYLLRGGRLAAFEEWVDRNPNDLGPLDRQFLQASQAQARRDLAAALEQSRVATGRSLLYQAESLRGKQAGLSLLIGIAAMGVNPSEEARSSLVTTLIGNHYVATMTGHGAEVSAVAFSPDGRTMATGGHGPPAMLWDIADPARPRLLSTLDAHTGAVWAISFGPDGCTMITGSPDSTVNLWDIADLAHPRILSTLTGNLSWVSSTALSADGRILLTGSWDNTGARQDKAIVWDVSNWAHPHRLSELIGQPNPTGPVRNVALTPDGRTAATANDDATVILWDITNPAKPRNLAVLTGHANSVWALAASPDGRTLLTGGADRTAILWDISDPSRPAQLSTLTGHNNNVRAVAFSPDGHTVATGSWDHTAILWRVDDLSRPVRLDTLGGHSESVYSVAFSPNGRRVATTSSDRTSVLWNVTGDAYPTRLARLTGHTDGAPALAFSPHGNTIVSGGADGTVILWNVTDPARPWRLATLTGHRAGIWPVTYSRDGHTLITGSMDTTAILWDVTDETRPRRLSTLAGHDHAVTSVSFAPDGHTVAIGSDDETATLWDITDQTDPRQLARLTGHRWPVRAVPFSPAGNTVVTCSTDTTAIVWDVTEPAKPRRLTTLTDENSAYGAAFSPDGRTLALAQEGRKTTLWDMSDRSHPDRIVTMRGQASSVYTVGFSPDGKLLCTGGYDKTAILWDITDQRRPRELVTLAGNALAVAAVVFSPDRRTLAVSGDESPVLWNIARLYDIVTRPVETGCTITGRGLSEQEWEKYAPDLPYHSTC